MIEVSARDAKKIKFAIKLANDKLYCEKITNFFNLNEIIIKDINIKFDKVIQENKTSRLWKLYLKHYKYFKKNNNGLPINQEVQKLVFTAALTVEVNDNFLSTYTELPSNSDPYEVWLSNLLFMYVPPNENILKIIKSYQATPKYFLEMIFGMKIEQIYKKTELNEEHQFIVKTIRDSRLFDEEYYLGKYPDIRANNIDPLVHYSLQGYREGRNPSIFFDSDAYYSMNADVKSANVNPLYHYIVAGHKENRKIKSLINTYKKTLSHSVKISTPELLNSKIIEFKNLQKEYDLIVMSHDDFTIRTGGIQKVILEETHNFIGKLLFISPTKDPEIFLAIDGNHQKGYLRSDSLRRVGVCNKLIIHSFINYDFAVLSRSLIFQKSNKIYLWAHDYSMCCSNYLLLRNNFQPCGAPPIDSTGCSICVYSKTRKYTIDFYSNFIKKYSKKLTIVTPSAYSKKLILSYLGKNSPEIYVRNHVELFPSRTRLKKIDNLKVAYVGSDQPHKGVGLFLELIKENSKLKYYLFSSRNFIGSSIIYIEHSTNSENELTDLLIAHDIDIVIIPSQWEETFCITAYEALAAGCKVFCLKGSGNLSELGKSNKNLNIFDDIYSMVAELESICDSKFLKKNYATYVNNMNLKYAK
jgi:hypothetical protein